MQLWCLISQPNSVIIEVRIDPKSKGQEVLEKGCEVLGIGAAEADYFGLRCCNSKGEEIWLNLRNPIERQVPTSGAPVRFILRVKFWVPPHLVLQDTTRHQMYLEVKFQVLRGEIKPSTPEGRLRLASLVCQAEFGDWDQSSLPPPPCHHSVSSSLSLDPNELAPLHAQIQGMKKSTAEYWVLKEVSMLENYGEEIFQCKQVRLGIGPHGVNIYQPTPKIIPYGAIRSASSLRRIFQLWYLGDDHMEIVLELKCESCQAASGLYRTLTEKHAFYSCDTVRGAVTAQYIRDLKGTIVSIFNESSPTGKKYVFDIQRTCREVHDNARRALYDPRSGEGQQGEKAEGCSNQDEAGNTTNKEKRATEKLARLVDALTCRICMDAGIDTVLFPCAHVICCHACAGRCTTCPLCRSPIESAKRVFLPTLELR